MALEVYRERIVAVLDTQLKKGDKALIGNSAYRRYLLRRVLGIVQTKLQSRRVIARGCEAAEAAEAGGCGGYCLSWGGCGIC